MAVPNLRATRFGDLTFEEVRSYVAAESLAIIPTGCTEQQGPHLSVDFDTWFAETLAFAAAQKAARDVGVPSVVLPALPFGPTPEHRGYGTGYIHLPAELHAEVVAHALRSLAEQGFKKLLVWRGCGGHDLGKAVKQFNKEWSGRATAFLPGAPFHGIWCRVGNPDVPVGHADSFTTSVALHLRPESVRVARIKHSPQSKVDWSASNLDFSQHSLSGVIGDPTHASAELGRKLWQETVAEVAKTIQKVYER